MRSILTCWLDSGQVLGQVQLGSDTRQVEDMGLVLLVTWHFPHVLLPMDQEVRAEERRTSLLCSMGTEEVVTSRSECI